MSSPADFITQVHNPEEDQQPEQPRGFCARFLCCLCQPKKPKSLPINNQTAQPVITHNTYHTAQQNGRGPTKPPPPPPTQGASPPLRNVGAPINPSPPPQKYLLGPLAPEDRMKKCLVLDLDETLVHSSFKPIPNADFVISIELENVVHRVYVRKRPGVDNFLKVVGEKFEVVIFTASLSKYADPLLDILDRFRIVKARLFREACVQHYGNYVKDLSHLGRRLEDTIIIDNSPFSYMFQPDNAIPITSWFNDKNDRQLYDLIPFLESLTNVDDVCQILQRKKIKFCTTITITITSTSRHMNRGSPQPHLNSTHAPSYHITIHTSSSSNTK